MQPRKLILLILAAAATVPARGEDMDFQWTKVQVAELNAGIRVTGRMIPQDGALNMESSRVGGRVLTILRREGESVKAGTALFAISSAECFSLAEEKKVAAANGMPELIDSAAKRERQLGLSVDANGCKIVATHSGILTKRSIESGAAFNPGDVLVTILDVNRLTAEFDLPERDLAKVRVGQAVHYRLASDPDHNYDTKISNIVPMIDSTSRTTKVRVVPVHVKTATTLDAMIFGTVDTGSKEPILKVPSASLVFNRSRQYVIKGPANKPSAVEVQVLGEADSFSSIRAVNSEALSENDEVATHGAIFLLKQLSGNKI